MLRRSILTVLATTALVTTAACNSDDEIRANVPTFTDTLQVYALTGTSPTLPSALNTVARTVVRTASIGSVNYDVALDIVSANEVIVQPARLLVSALAGAPEVRLLYLPDSTFDSIKRAPDTYYRPDTALTVQTGKPFIVLTSRRAETTVCFYVPTVRVFTKVVIDSINTTSRRIYFRQVLNPNCGYRSFEPGLPAN